MNSRTAWLLLRVAQWGDATACAAEVQAICQCHSHKDLPHDGHLAAKDNSVSNLEGR